MATLTALFDRRSDTDLRNRVAAACWNQAKAIFSDNGEGPEIRRVFRAAVVLLQDAADPADAQVEAAVGNVVNAFAVTGA